MNRRHCDLLVALMIVGSLPTAAAQTINGNALALRSSGSAAGSSWTLANNGYVGTYITLAAPGDVTVSVQASGQAASAISPRMNIAIADTSVPFDVAAGLN